ncbi:P-loop containing nucleoside triphosphate hydrolase protein [Trichoderma velutinum]
MCSRAISRKPGSIRSSYNLGMWCIRQWNLPVEPGVLKRIRTHTSVLYALNWLCLVFMVLSAGTEPTGKAGAIVNILLGVLVTFVLLLHVTAPNTIVESTSRRFSISVQLGKEVSASLISRWTFSCVDSVIWRAFRAHLKTSDLYELNWADTARVTSRLFNKAAPATLKLVLRLYHFTKHDLMNQGAWAVLFSLTSFCPAFLLRFILDYLQSPSTMPQNNAWLCVWGLLVAGIITGIADCQCEWLGRKISVRLRAILIDGIFSKVLKKRLTRPAKSSAEQENFSGDIHATDGTILNLMAVDAANVLVATISLYSILGTSGILGVVLMIALLPLNVLVSKRQVTAQMKVLSAADARVQASNELITNIRVIKLCAWEEEFRKKIRLLRATELLELRVRFFWWSISMTVFYSLPFITTVLTLFIYTIVENQRLETKVAFPALAVFAALRIPLDRMSSMISFILQAQVSVSRIEKFLKEKETSRNDQLMGSDLRMIGFDNATFEWPVQDVDIGAGEDVEPVEILPIQDFRLSNLDIKFYKNGLNVICGPSGSGKSSLLLGLLGEMELLRGRVHLPLAEPPMGDDSLISGAAYYPQEPWIMNQTIRANILFGLHFQMFEDGDLAIAGERGNRLSGGQKQRVALARALYSHAQFLLLDDCLSVLDSHTGRHILLHAIKGPLMKGRTCILATHHSQLALPHCDYAVFLENGMVKQQGTASELVELGITVENRPAAKAKDMFDPMDVIHHPQMVASALLASGTSEVESSESWTGNTTAASEGYNESMYHEYQMTGVVSLSVIRVYLTAMGEWWFWTVVFFAFALQQITSLGTNLWIKVWAHEFDEAVETSKISQGSPTRAESVYYLAIYSSARMFDGLLNSILHARLIFFDKVPFGQITNRFSRDVEAVDQEVAPHSMSTFYTFCSLCIVIILISTSIPLFIPAAVIICLIYYIITVIYINSARDLKRIESAQRSPLYQHFGEALAGYVSVRAYGRVNRFTEENRIFIDGYNQPYVLIWAAKEWLTLRIASLSALISSLTGAFLLWGLGRGAVDAGVAGLVLTYAATFSDNVLWFVQLYVIVQQSFNSVERIVEYTGIKSERSEPLEPSSYDLSPQWPIHGHVSFQGYTARYAPELNPVLLDLNIDIHAGQRVAVVGPLEADTGRITIDGVSIASVNLVRLRRAVTVVPQDPTLFGGSLRDNLDPLNHHSDDDLQDVLRKLQFFQSLPSGDLDHPAAALSMGQRQLVCIARALLRRSRVLILDEATASIDHATDALIQAGLRYSIADGITVLTIAHRLLTIVDYDRVMVLDSGRIVEQGSVAELLQKRGDEAFFRQLCEHSGDLDRIERVVRGL